MTCTQVHVAWNLTVPADLMADEFVRPWDDRVRAKRLTPGIQGEGDVNTRYIGAKSSARRLRVYRKDLQSEAWLFDYGPTMRVELILKEEQARAWWAVWEASESDAYASAAAHLLDMTGWCPPGIEPGLKPPLQPEPITEVSQQLFYFLVQHGAQLSSFADAGVDVFGLADAARAGCSRMTEFLASQRLKEIRAVGVEALEDRVRALLSRRAAHV
jgi:hypothetical protein